MEAENCQNKGIYALPWYLEIGDWVCMRVAENRVSPPMYVVGIWADGVYLEIDEEQGDPFEVSYADIVPIEMTEEIAKKNNIPMQKVKYFGFHYVHQLQHFLHHHHQFEKIIV